MKMKLAIWNGPKCGLVFQPNIISSRCPASCENQSTPGYRDCSQPDEIDAQRKAVHLGEQRDQKRAEGAERPPVVARARLEEAVTAQDEDHGLHDPEAPQAP